MREGAVGQRDRRTEREIARATVGCAARSRPARSERAADGRTLRKRGIERNPLTVFGECPRNERERRAGGDPGRHIARIVFGDAVQPVRLQHDVDASRRVAERLQRRAAG